MKKLLYLLVVLTMSICAQSVKHDGKNGEITELKNQVSKYCTVVLYDLSDRFVAKAEIDRTWVNFVDNETGKNVEFFTVTGLLNFMDKEGWRYINSIPAGAPMHVKQGYVFEKIVK